MRKIIFHLWYWLQRVGYFISQVILIESSSKYKFSNKEKIDKNDVSWARVEISIREIFNNLLLKIFEREDFDWADDDVREFDIPQSDTKRLSNIEEEPEPKETQPKNISPKKVVLSILPFNFTNL